MLRRVRSRFGVSAPRVTVRAHIPWYWRLLATALLLTAVIVLASWVYVIGLRYAGYDKTLAEQELSALRDRVEILETEAKRLRSIGSSSESSLQIERTAQLRLSEQVKRLEAENSRLREDLAEFENIASGETKTKTISIHRMRVEPDLAVEGAYRYRLLLAAPASRLDREFRGRLQLIATVQREDKIAIVEIPDAASPDLQKFLVNFKYFRRIEGSIMLPTDAVLKKLEARLMQGATMVASQQVML